LATSSFRDSSSASADFFPSHQNATITSTLRPMLTTTGLNTPRAGVGAFVELPFGPPVGVSLTGGVVAPPPVPVPAPPPPPPPVVTLTPIPCSLE
jgi:hypothetical protein